MLEGKKYEVIVGRDLPYNAKKLIPLKDNPINSIEQYLEKILNDYAENGYKVVAVFQDNIIMEKL